MGTVLHFPPLKTPPTSWDSLTKQAERSSLTPARQTGQPAFLFLFPDGKIHLRTTPTGYQALELIKHEDPHFPLTVKYAQHPTGARPVSAEGELDTHEMGDLISVKLPLDEYLVVHTYLCDEADVHATYKRSFRRAVRAPLPAPQQRYLWTIDFGVHGGTWLFGTSRDLEEARQLGEKNDMVSFTDLQFSKTGELECIALASKRKDLFLNQLAQEEFWLRREQSWCECH